MNKKSIKVVDGLLTYLTIDRMAKSLAKGDVQDLEECQNYFIDKKLGYIIDALLLIKEAKKNKVYSCVISLANSEWSDKVTVNGRVAKQKSK